MSGTPLCRADWAGGCLVPGLTFHVPSPLRLSGAPLRVEALVHSPAWFHPNDAELWGTACSFLTQGCPPGAVTVCAQCVNRF